MRFFNVAGPCIEGRHYMLPPLDRIPDARKLVDQGAYFVIHAPRQTGKTTSIRALAHTLTAEGRYAALAFSCETAAGAREDTEAAQRAILHQLRVAARLDLPDDLRPPTLIPAEPAGMLTDLLMEWSLSCPRPLVLLFDEIDALRGESLLSVLRQLRAGFQYRGRCFP